MKFKKLFESASIGSMKLKNRIILAPMGTGSMQNPGGTFNERIRDYYSNIARGGAGLIITGSTFVSNVVGPVDKTVINTCFLNRSYIGGANEMIEAVHRYGAKVCLQLCINHGRTFPMEGEPAMCASAGLTSPLDSSKVSRMVSAEELEQIIHDYGYAAGLAKSAGFDAIEMRSYGGYFTDEFMTSLWNKRTDEYGGDLDGRLRLLMRTVEAVQENCSKDFPLIVKYTPVHGLPGGRTIDEGIEIAKRLEAAGVHALHVDYGAWDNHYNMIPPSYFRPAENIWVAEEIRKNVTIPVIANGKLGVRPELAESVIEDGKTDFVALGRTLLADPDWPRKVKTGKLKDIRPCIGCLKCQERISSDFYLSCAVNPVTGMERDFSLKKSDNPKRVLVVGAGPGGIAAAITASECEHNVILEEKNNYIGGHLVEASAADNKFQLRDLIEYYRWKISDSDIDLRLNTYRDISRIPDEEYDAVIISTGAVPIMPEKLNIKCNVPVITSDDVLSGKKQLEELGEKVIVFGGSEVGCETAMYISDKCPNKTVIIASRKDKLASAAYYTTSLWINENIDKKGIERIHYSEIIEINEKEAVLRINDEVKTVPMETAVFSLGYERNTNFKETHDLPDNFFVIGDAARPREVLSAVWEGFHVAKLLDELVI